MMITYARVKAIKGQINKRGKELIVQPSFWLPDDTPFYANGDYLEIVVGQEEIRIYNPQQLRFNVNKLVSVVATLYRMNGQELKSYNIIRA